MESSVSVEVLNPKEPIKLYKYRWIVIIISGIYSAVNFAQFMQLTIIGDILKKYYDVSDFLINMSGLCFMISFIVLFYPVGYIMEHTSLKTTSIICTGLNLIGNCIKIFATVPGTYYLLLISQTIVSIAQIFMLILPSKVAASWFGAEEVSKACAIGLFGTQIGLAAGGVIPTQMVKKGDDELVEEGLSRMFIYNAIISAAVFVIVILFFRSKPKSPPSPSQAALSSTGRNDLSFSLALKGFATNKQFLLVLFSIGVNYGLWNTFTVLLNQLYTNSFPNEDDGDLGILTFVTCLTGGCFGSIIFGYILDKTHKYKLVAFFVQFATLVSTIAQAVALLSSSKWATFIAVPTYGFFSGSLFVIGYEYTVETTFPTPESYGISVLNVIIYIFGLVFTLIFTYVFDTFGYLIGWIMLIVVTGVGTFSILLVSSELKRRNANVSQDEDSVDPQ